MVLESILGGGFAGAAVVVFLSKTLINSQIEKSLKQFQHDLDRKKDQFQLELSIYAERARLTIANHGQKSVSALETIYGAVVRTSLPRHGFKKMGAKVMHLTDNNQINAKYFELFSQNFQAFDRAFQSVTQAYAVLEEQSIYLDETLEGQTVTALGNVLECYRKWHAQFADAHSSARAQFDQGSLNEQTRNMDFDAFYESMLADWNRIIGPTKKGLKSKVRELLAPSKVMQVA